MKFAISEKPWCPARLSCARCSSVTHGLEWGQPCPHLQGTHPPLQALKKAKSQQTPTVLKLVIYRIHWNSFGYSQDAANVALNPFRATNSSSEGIAIILYKFTLILHVVSTKNPEFEGTHMDHPTSVQTTQRSHHVPSKINFKNH